MLKKYLSKFAMDILPSVAATIIGAYIVNHYIAAKPATDAAAAVSTAEPKADAKATPEAAGVDRRGSEKAAEKASEKPPDFAGVPEPGVKAKGISEKAVLEKSAAGKPPAVDRPAEKIANKPTETASLPVETRRRLPWSREKAVAKSIAAPVAPAPATVVPVIAAPVAAAPIPGPPVETAVAPEERRDANDLARAAIERLRSASDGSPRTQEAAGIQEAPRVASPPQLRPLPPPIMVSTPQAETFDSSSGSRPPYPGATHSDVPVSARPTPPADIPEPSRDIPESSRPLDLRADATVEAPKREHRTVAEDVLSAAKSVFHAVLPK